MPGKRGRPRKKPSVEPPPELPEKKPRENISRLDLRVGIATHVQEHPVNRKYYIIHVDIGGRVPRRSITRLGLKQERLELLNHKLVVLCNMQYNVKGLFSDCFVLYAKFYHPHEFDAPRLAEYIRPPARAQPGDRVFAPGYPFDPLKDWPFLTGGKELYREATRKLRVSSNKVVKYNKTPLRTVHEGLITTFNLYSCDIRI